MGKVCVIGAGEMAKEYVKVLKDLDSEISVIGRSKEKCHDFYNEVGIMPEYGGVEDHISKVKMHEYTIVTVGIESLSSVAKFLITNGVDNILLEKPAVGYASEIEELVSLAEAHNSNVLIAYNRRFYASIQKAQEIIREDGGPLSFSFEFTEWSHIIKKLKKDPIEHNNWFLGNSTHVIDAAFYLGGEPKELCSFVTGKDELNWHPTSSNYSGAGESKNGALFSYLATWNAPGRWAIEVLTKNNRIHLRPMEKIQIQKLGSIKIEEVMGVDYQLDENFKPGLFRQTEAFINHNWDKFCTLIDQKRHMEYYRKMSGYK